MTQQRIPAVFMRGGTSRAIFFKEEDLPADGELRDRIFLASLGSPDAYGRQLNGLGGGSSSTSKVAVIGPASVSGIDVDFTFAQVDVGSALVDHRGTCGNISSAVGPYAIDERMVASLHHPETIVTFLNTNTQKRVVAYVPIQGAEARFDGDFAVDGVSGTGARIRLDFLDPGGAGTGRLLPTGHAQEDLLVDGIGAVRASLIDATNPMVFVRASDLGLTGIDSPASIDADRALVDRLERIRATAAVRMGLSVDERQASERSPAIPKIALVAGQRDYRTIAGELIYAADADLRVVVMSMGKAHRAVALTAAMCLAVAARIPGTVVSDLATETAPDGDIRIGHPSGVLPIAARVERDASGYRAVKTTVYRTARRLMEGWICVPSVDQLPQLATFDSTRPVAAD